jgi:hypothetical protein
MDIHKPKPWHGAREFLKEYAIIVVGVLTALAGEQGVEWLHNRAELAEARAALRQEIDLNGRTFRFAVAEDRCYLAAMDGFIAWAKGGPRPAPIVDVVGFPGPGASVWEVARSGAVAHMPLKERLAYANFYSLAANYLTLVAGERGGAGTLGHYAYLDSLTPQEARTLLQEASATRPFLRIKIRQGELLLQRAKTLGAGPGLIGDAEGRARLERTCRVAGAPLAID